MAGSEDLTEEAIVYVDVSEVVEGRVKELKEEIAHLARFVKEKEPKIVSFAVYFDEEETRMTVVHVHPDARSLEMHMQVAGPLFSRFAPMIRLLSIDVHGACSQEVVRRLHEKTKTLGSGVVRVHSRHAGFMRMPRISA